MAKNNKIETRKVKLFNLENTGKGIMIPFNGLNYFYPDGHEGEVPVGVINNIIDTDYTGYRLTDANLGEGETVEEYKVSRFKVVFLDSIDANNNNLKSENEKLKAEIEKLKSNKAE